MLAFGFPSAWWSTAFAQTSVLTRAYDNFRSGWNRNEHVLSPASVGARRGEAETKLVFSLLAPITQLGGPSATPTDDQVDAQPLVVSHVKFRNAVRSQETAYYNDSPPGDLVYLATEDNHVLVVDAETGVIIGRRSLQGRPVAKASCYNNAPAVGVMSTPVIDPAQKAMFLIADTDTPEGVSYLLYKISVETLEDLQPPVMIQASEKLSDGTTVTFDAARLRQRPALLLKGNDLYAAFSSACDLPLDSATRGWLLGWEARTLKPLPDEAAHDGTFHFLPNRSVNAPDGKFLTGIWMSGAGPAADEAGDIYFSTGNGSAESHPRSVDGTLDQSFIRFSTVERRVVSFFAPGNADDLNSNDQDFGSGGPLLVPDAIDGLPDHLALTAGKDGRLFLLDRDSLGGFKEGPDGGDRVLDVAKVSPPGEQCRCAPVYFRGARPYVAIGAGHSLSLFELASGAAGAALHLLARNDLEPFATNGYGFGVSVSSDGQAGPVIWLVSRTPDRATRTLYLYAFDAEANDAEGKLRLLTRVPAGVWHVPTAGTGVAPVVANGKVFVASGGQLRRFGLVPVDQAVSGTGEETAGLVPREAVAAAPERRD
jgi:hypothetical protein